MSEKLWRGSTFFGFFGERSFVCHGSGFNWNAIPWNQTNEFRTEFYYEDVKFAADIVQTSSEPRDNRHSEIEQTSSELIATVFMLGAISLSFYFNCPLFLKNHLRTWSKGLWRDGIASYA